MTDAAEWPSSEFATCSDCGQPLSPQPDGDGGRFYSCGCKDFIDADELDETIAREVLTHLQRRLARLAFNSGRVRALWSNANASTRRAMIRTELKAVTVSRSSEQMRLAYVWNTEQPGPEPAPRPRRGHSGNERDESR